MVEDPNLSHSTVRVAVHIAMRMNGAKQSGAWPSTATIAKWACVSVRAVLYGLDELSGLDRKTGDWTGRRYLSIERKRNTGNRYWRNTGNRYWLNFWWE